MGASWIWYDTKTTYDFHHEFVEDSRWWRFQGKTVVLYILYVFILIGIIFFIEEFVIDKNLIITDAIERFNLIYLYVAGVIITAKLNKWVKLNFSSES